MVYIVAAEVRTDYKIGKYCALWIGILVMTQLMAPVAVAQILLGDTIRKAFNIPLNKPSTASIDTTFKPNDMTTPATTTNTSLYPTLMASTPASQAFDWSTFWLILSVFVGIGLLALLLAVTCEVRAGKPLSVQLVLQTMFCGFKFNFTRPDSKAKSDGSADKEGQPIAGNDAVDDNQPDVANAGSNQMHANASNQSAQGQGQAIHLKIFNNVNGTNQ
ncbi:unnamed protein product [Oppiella nova]|uniref:Uncharacterized protein n=1 Tax=Oppiella nova TaxID=334625 RepID=A0A7R9QN65_9ACAR|nr:unnamed protein product [Oppiella nova]CAG2169205.1 unnamed protein product [Oppiella nova]